MGEVDQHLATKLLKQSGMEDEHQLDQEIQLLQDRVTKTRQKMAASAAAAANPGEVTSNDNFWSNIYLFCFTNKHINIFQKVCYCFLVIKKCDEILQHIY